MFPIPFHTTRLDHPSVSVFAITANHQLTAPDFIIGVYIYCHGVHNGPIQSKPTALLGSTGIAVTHSAVNSFFIPFKVHAVAGYFPLSI